MNRLHLSIFVNELAHEHRGAAAESVLSHAIPDLTWAESTLWSGNEINPAIAKVWLMNSNFELVTGRSTHVSKSRHRALINIIIQSFAIVALANSQSGRGLGLLAALECARVASGARSGATGQVEFNRKRRLGSSNRFANRFVRSVNFSEPVLIKQSTSHSDQ